MHSDNIVSQVAKEIERVKAGIEKLDAAKRDEAERTIRFAALALEQVALNDLYESLDDLKEIAIP